MPRTRTAIESDLTAAYARDRELKLRTPEYRFNRQHIAALVVELDAINSHGTGAFTPENYTEWPDSFEQGALNRKRAEAFLDGQRAAKTARRAEIDRLYAETQRKAVA